MEFGGDLRSDVTVAQREEVCLLIGEWNEIFEFISKKKQDMAADRR